MKELFSFSRFFCLFILSLFFFHLSALKLLLIERGVAWRLKCGRREGSGVGKRVLTNYLKLPILENSVDGAGGGVNGVDEVAYLKQCG